MASSNVQDQEAPPRGRNGSTSGRPAKRARYFMGNDGYGGGLAPALPPEVWAMAMHYAPFQTILSCAATSRSMLHDVTPLLTKLHIDQPSQINLSVAPRFRDVREIRINSLLRAITDENGFEFVDVDFETAHRAVPFLSRFGKLERLYFRVRGYGEDDDVGGCTLANKDYSPWDREIMLEFIDHVSAGFRCSAFPRKLKISGLCCPDIGRYFDEQNHTCETCVRACRSFPLESVLSFECEGSSFSQARSGRSHGLDVCINRAHIESIIESRPGGHELLQSEERLLRQLGRGRRYRIPLDGCGKTLHMVKYEQDQIDEIKWVIKYASLDLKQLSPRKVYGAITRSFAHDDNGGIRPPTPPKNQCYLSPASLEYLQTDIGLPIVKEEYVIDLRDLLKYVQPIVRVLKELQDDDEFQDIEIDCLGLIRRFLEIENNPPIQKIASAIPYLVDCLERDFEYQMEAASSLKSILAKGTEEHKTMAIDAEVITSFKELLASPEDRIVEVAALTLVDVATSGTKEHVAELAKAGGVSKLVCLLDSHQPVCVESSLKMLVAVATEDHTKKIAVAEVLPRLVRMIMSPHQGNRVLANCAILLRKLVEIHSASISRLASSTLPPRLVEIVTTSKDLTIQTNFAHVMIHLVAGTTGTSDRMGSLVHETDFLPVLADLADSPDGCISEKDIGAIGKIANTPEHHELALQTGVTKHLIRLLLRCPSEMSALRTASWTFAKFCRGVLSYFGGSQENS